MQTAPGLICGGRRAMGIGKAWVVAGLAMLSPAALFAADRAIPALEQAAGSGDAEAAYQLGRAYKLGDGVPADAKQAERWFSKALQLGHAKAGAELGLVLAQSGRPVDALPLLRKAAEQGDPRAQYALGTFYFSGTAVPADTEQAKFWVRRAAAAGLPAAAEALAIMDKPSSATEEPVRIVSVPPQKAQEPVRKMALAETKLAPVRRAVMAPPVGDAWLVQLGAFAQQGNARRYWQSVQMRMPGEVRPAFVDNGGVTKLRLGPFATKAEAARFCALQRQEGRACFEVR
ncbi:SPOR domain-containing protein [Sphingomonas tabacisoli]|uniref:SPOR domain-containing protein n=1 Tax=Sphingomonas tabacisoli TaxID=2249466 RepID=A0ABW4I2P8_9SPHN